MTALLAPADEHRIVEAIRAAESRTSGEIHVHLERRSGGRPLEAARRWFVRLRMDRTRERNGILFYVAVDERLFAVVGDAGIHERVGVAFWESLRDVLAGSFAAGDHAGGLVRAIGEAGKQLAEHFPRRGDDENELPDEVSTS
ncbi:MAG TPA: TPM domain-containing protein [Candidatus Polarisedimenticolaceae bacterium]|nr:TPM domain-containing protein [Candidatus Polarisedimenticolaceae bacterium]